MYTRIRNPFHVSCCVHSQIFSDIDNISTHCVSAVIEVMNRIIIIIIIIVVVVVVVDEDDDDDDGDD